MSCDWGTFEKRDLVKDVQEIKDGLLYVRGDIEDIKLCMIKVMQILLGDKYNDEMKELFGEEGKNELNNFDKEISQRREEYQKIMEQRNKEDEELLKIANSYK